MTRILVTGGTGTLGREVVQQLLEQGSAVRVVSRGERPALIPPGIEWFQADFATGVDLTAAVTDVDIVIHTASNVGKAKQVDVDGTRALLVAARGAGVQHLVYVSIVGIDRIPLPYYRHKLEAEQLVRDARLPWTILRATQFHQLLDTQLSLANRLPLMVLPTDLRFQPIDPTEVATRLVQIANVGPQHDVREIGGPEVLTLGELAHTWLTAHGLKRRMVHVPLPGKIAHALRSGFNTCPDHCYGTVRWTDWIPRTPGTSVHSLTIIER
jgi:uncharacterized protein YbjT (DUF2867 family)